MKVPYSVGLLKLYVHRVAPRIVAVEGVVERKNTLEIIERIFLAPDQHTAVYQGEYDLAQIAGRADPPELEN